MAATTAPRPPRIVVLTGASSGIGRAAAVELARAGNVTLALVARRREALEATVREATAAAGPGTSFELLPCDLTDRAALARLGAEIRERFDRLDALVNNAGTGSPTDFEDPDAPAASDQMLELNLRAPIALVHELLPRLAATPGSVVVNVSSVAGLVGTPNSPVYSATKWGLTGFSEALRARLAGAGVRVACIQPGPVPTPGWPHERLMRRPLLRRVLACDAETIARAVRRSVEGQRGADWVVRPRIYAGIPTLRGLAPWAIRALVRAGGART